MKNKINFIIIFLLLFCFAATPLEAQAIEAGFYPAKVKDISDRAYEKTVIGLLDNAQESIVISMYILRPGTDPRHTINRLMKDLEEALERGVSVTIYLNTRIDETSRSISGVGEGEPFDTLRQKGAQIYLTSPRYMLHDKMLIVDSRFVVIGSTNWSISALTDNFESSVLIDSPPLANQRLKRMKTIHLKGEDLRGPPQISLEEVYPLPELVEMPVVLMENKRYFPQMLSKHDNRAMDLYLLLIAESYRRGVKEFHISLEKFAGQLNMPEEWDAADLRRQVIKTLRKLKNTYGLIDVRFKHAYAAKIRLIDIEGETFPLKRGFFEPSFLAGQRQNKKFILLIEACLKDEGKDIDNFNYSELSRMFNVHRITIREGMQK